MLDLSVLDDAELSTLIKAMHEARFAEKPLDLVVWNNPFVIDLHVAALAESTRRRAKGGDTLPTDERFYQWRGRPEHLTVLRRFDEDPFLRRIIATHDVDYITSMLRPFILDEAIAEELWERATRPS